MSYAYKRRQSVTRFIFVVGGVISGIGKGITTASLGKIIKDYGFDTTLIKIDPYLNYDAGTLRPTEHGEVWVTEDGGEIDQDLGTYERFTNENIPKQNNITSGQIYKAVIDRERSGEYLGKTVQFIPHIPEEIIRRIKLASAGYEVAIIEIGGTVGDYENAPFLFAAKTLEQEFGSDMVAYVLITYLPVPYHITEMKTKPTQQALRLLRQEGIIPNFVVCRTTHPLDDERKSKIEFHAQIDRSRIIAAPDVKSIYEVPLNFRRDDFGPKLLEYFGLEPRKKLEWAYWKEQVQTLLNPKKSISIGIVGKYIESGAYELFDSYVSIEHALLHAAASQGYGCKVTWLDAKRFETDSNALKDCEQFDGILVPGGFGSQGVNGKLAAIQYVREHEIPFLGICYGMQLAVVEYARHVAGLKDAHTTEVDQTTPYPVIDLLPIQKQYLEQHNLGGTMRLGSYEAFIKPNTVVHGLYDHSTRVAERHRHRYEVNPAYVAQLEQVGLVFSGYHERSDGTRLMEYIELPNHPFFVATQAHPEFKSRFGFPNQLYSGFMKACIERHQLIDLSSCDRQPVRANSSSQVMI